MRAGDPRPPTEPPARDSPETEGQGPGPPGPGLAVGITEPNPAFVWSPRARPSPPAAAARWRDELTDLAPRHYRLMLSWDRLQPVDGRPADLQSVEHGCMRNRRPCLPWQGLREQLAALASRQVGGGWETEVVISGTPAWAAQGPGSCEREGTEPRARPPRADALGSYERLVEDVIALARQEGADLRWWSPWNEPNHPYFLANQRQPPCAQVGRSPAAATYSRLSAALDRALARAPGRQERVVGELAGFLESGPRTTAAGRFLRQLDSGVVCGSRVLAQHAYIGGEDPTAAVWTAISQHACPRRHTVWITETGAGLPSAALSAAGRRHDRAEGCRELHDRLVSWYWDPRVSAAFQYTLREDDMFRTGLVSTDLREALPTLAEWQAWGGGRDPRDPPPEQACDS